MCKLKILVVVSVILMNLFFSPSFAKSLLQYSDFIKMNLIAAEDSSEDDSEDWDEDWDDEDWDEDESDDSEPEDSSDEDDET